MKFSVSNRILTLGRQVSTQKDAPPDILEITTPFDPQSTSDLEIDKKLGGITTYEALQNAGLVSGKIVKESGDTDPTGSCFNYVLRLKLIPLLQCVREPNFLDNIIEDATITQGHVRQ